ncbi:Ubiquitin-conjugating enzyme E2 15 [Borealophlyctis nickersoniae]|nr:Ubiquitin-conjugating enzyme E2 15 [Borealophlyctis nickersoniae]
MSDQEAQSSLLLRRQLKELAKSPVEGFSAGLSDENNIYEWDVMIVGPEGTDYEGGFFKARLSFPRSYPQMPPKMRFISEMWHPNVYSNGVFFDKEIAGEDKFGYEQSGERWLPIHTVETIVLSVISMLSSPNDESPANLEAAREWRESPAAFKKKCRRIARRSVEDS